MAQMLELRKENKLFYICVRKVKEIQIWNKTQITLVEMKVTKTEIKDHWSK